VTLVPTDGEKCWGVAYCLPPGREDEVLAYLDHRERGGYVRIQVEFTVAPSDALASMGVAGFNDDNAAVGTKTVTAITYIAAPTNSHYLGPAPLDVMVAQIAFARGESGRNAEYVLNLANHLRQMGLEDEHIQQLAKGVADKVAKGECCSPVLGLRPLAMV
jgi:cation transport regulator ChaC